MINIGTVHDRYTWALGLFERREYRDAAKQLAELVDELSTTTDERFAPHSLADLRLLLARAYYHSAQLRHAEEVLVDLVRTEPQDAYAHLLLARTLERAGRADEARGHRTLAELLGDLEPPAAPAVTVAAEA